MINVIEVKKMMPNATPIETIMPDALADVMPMIEDKIINTAKDGFSSCIVVKSAIIIALKEFYFLSYKSIMDAIVKEAKKAGFVAYTTESYSSIHFSWEK